LLSFVILIIEPCEPGGKAINSAFVLWMFISKFLEAQSHPLKGDFLFATTFNEFFDSAIREVHVVILRSRALAALISKEHRPQNLIWRDSAERTGIVSKALAISFDPPTRALAANQPLHQENAWATHPFDHHDLTGSGSPSPANQQAVSFRKGGLH